MNLVEQMREHNRIRDKAYEELSFPGMVAVGVQHKNSNPSHPDSDIFVVNLICADWSLTDRLPETFEGLEVVVDKRHYDTKESRRMRYKSRSVDEDGIVTFIFADYCNDVYPFSELGADIEEAVSDGKKVYLLGKTQILLKIDSEEELKKFKDQIREILEFAKSAAYRWHQRSELVEIKTGHNAVFWLKDYLSPGGKYKYEELPDDLQAAHEAGHPVILLSVPRHVMLTSSHIENLPNPWSIVTDDGLYSTPHEALGLK